MAFKIDKRELAKVSYLRVDDLKGRAIPFFPCYHGVGDWELWMQDGNDKLVRMKVTDLVEGKYFAKTLYKVTDVYFSFFDFMCKRAYWPDIAPFIEGIYDDLQNVGTSIAKIELFHKESKRSEIETRRFVITELEYLFSVCRSLYDLLQECLATMWPKVESQDPKLGKRQLPTSFRKMLMESNSFMSEDRIASKFSIPNELAFYYCRQREFFLWLREFRDYVSHSGKSIEFVFPTDKGFAISIDSKPFSSMSIWGASNTVPKNLGSVKSLVAHVAARTFAAIEEFTNVIQKIIVFPSDVSPEYRIFISGPNTANLQNLENHVQHEPWYDVSAQ